MSSSPAESAFRARTDLQPYGVNARLLFALQLRFDIDDLDSVAASALVDGADDKGCDLVYLDKSRATLIVAQGYESERVREAAQSRKADSLNTAATWLFSREYADVPDRLRSVAHEVREAIGAGEIETVEFWYVHNLPESENCRQSMATVQHSARNALEGTFGTDVLPATIVGIEVGAARQEEWYEALAVHILVSDEFTLDVPGMFRIDGDGWTAVATSVRASWLRDMYSRHKERLFSANYREYLGVRTYRSRNTINEGIQNTAASEPGRFWVYNNGVSAIVSGVDTIQPADGAAARLRISGLSIVNGAQTTGAIGSLSAVPEDSTLVPIRFIRCTDDEIIARIVRYNNSQNPLLPADFKSNDEIQRRLRDEFRAIPGCEYSGGRRGVDRIRQQANLLPSDTCAQALAAFHGRPDIAYHRKAEIWQKDEVYREFFGVHTTASHVLCAYALLKAVERKKWQLHEKRASDALTDQETKQVDFLSRRGAIHLLVAAIAASLESVTGRRISSRFGVSFGGGTGQAEAIQRWGPIVSTSIAFAPQLSLAINSGVRTRGDIDAAINAFCQSVEGLKNSGPIPVFEEFAKSVAIQ